MPQAEHAPTDVKQLVLRGLAISISTLVLTAVLLRSGAPPSSTLIWIVVVSGAVFIIPMRLVLFMFLGILPYFPGSLWYAAEEGAQAIYESEFLSMKPIEPVLALFVVRVALLQVLSRGAIYINKNPMMWVSILWLALIPLQIAVGLILGNERHDVMVYSEWRSLAEWIIFFWASSYVVSRNNLREPLAISVMIHGAAMVFLASVEFTALFPPVFHHNGYFIGESTKAILGAAGDHYWALLAFSLLVSYSVHDSSQRQLRLIPVAFAGLIFVAIGIGPRRMPVAMLLVAVCIIAVMTHLSKRTRIAAISAGLGCMLWLAASFAGINAEDFVVRIKSMNIFAFDDSSVPGIMASNQGHLNDLTFSLEKISERPLLGYGLGCRFLVFRTGVRVAAEMHSGLLHTWLRYGLLGAVFYIAYFLQWFRWSRQEWKQRINATWIPLGVLAFCVATFVCELARAPFYQGIQKYGAVSFALLLLVAPKRPEGTVAKSDEYLNGQD